MKTMLCIILLLILFSASYAQIDAADLEIYTQTSGSSGDTIRFWMLALGPVWDIDGTPFVLDDQRLTSSFDSGSCHSLD